MMKQYHQMNRNELEACLKNLFKRREIDPDAETVLFIDNSGAVIFNRFEEPKYSVMRTMYADIEKLIKTINEFYSEPEIVYTPLLEDSVKSAFSNYSRKQKIVNNEEDDFVNSLVGNA